MPDHEAPISDATDHPPMTAGAMPVPRTVWPTVLGVIGIILGALGALQGGMGLLAPLFVGVFRGAASQPGGFDPFAGVDQYKSLLTVSSVLTIVAGAMLLGGSILLVMRRSVARATILSWSGFKILVTLFGAWLGWLVNQAQFASMQQSGTTPAGMGGFMDVMSGVGVVIGVAWGWALPLFMIIWFMRANVKRDVASW